MDMKKAMLAAMQEYLLPELEEIKSGQSRMETELKAVNTRLDDVNHHLMDQSRRIDAVREELNTNINAVREELGQRIDETNQRIDETNQRIDAVRDELNTNINAVREELGQRIGETNQRIDAVRKELNTNINAVREELGQRIDVIHQSIGTLYAAIVRREEHSALVIKINEMDHEIREIKQRLAA